MEGIVLLCALDCMSMCVSMRGTEGEGVEGVGGVAGVVVLRVWGQW